MLLRWTQLNRVTCSLAKTSFSTAATRLRLGVMERVDTTARLEALRKLMQQNEVDIYIVPSEDAHQSEFKGAADARRDFVSGFSGSAGTAVITQDKAALATDGRYYAQASSQLDDNWTLLKQGLQGVPTWQDWTVDQASQEGGNKTVGVDPTLITASEAKKLSDQIRKKGGRDLVAVRENLVDKVWGSQRPNRTNDPVKVHDIEYAGKRWEEKVEELRKELDKRSTTGFVINVLDEVAWLFNLRGNDLDCDPVFYAYALITLTSIVLYVDQSKLSQSVVTHLDGVVIKPYEAVFADLEQLAAESSHPTQMTEHSKKTKCLVPNQGSWALSRALGDGELVEEGRSPIQEAKACKNSTELDGMRSCHIRDGAFITQFFAWLEEELVEKRTVMDELQAAAYLLQLRQKDSKFHSPSFGTISSSGSNAAIIHYMPDPHLKSVIDPAKMYLCDSGAQYFDGTTDTTRTVHFGQPTAYEREAYTMVLKGNIALTGLVFPKGTSGFAVDAIARQFLWKTGLDYRHSTGHGVGSFLNVHEGPFGIGHRIQYVDVPLAAGNVVSNEPGFYEDGNFGIRIENVLIVKEIETKYRFGERPYLGFETVTMVPMCRKLIDTSLLTAEELEWLNSYHKLVYDKLHLLLKGDTRSLKWLSRECAPLTKDDS